MFIKPYEQNSISFLILQYVMFKLEKRPQGLLNVTHPPNTEPRPPGREALQETNDKNTRDARPQTTDIGERKKETRDATNIFFLLLYQEKTEIQLDIIRFREEKQISYLKSLKFPLIISNRRSPRIPTQH